MSGWNSCRQRSQSSNRTRLYSRLRGAPSSFTRPRSRATSWLPRKPDPPVISTRLSAQKSIASSTLYVRELVLEHQQVRGLEQLVDAGLHVDLGLEPLTPDLGVGDLVVPLILVLADLREVQIVVDLPLDEERDVLLVVVHLLGADVVDVVPHGRAVVDREREGPGH